MANRGQEDIVEFIVVIIVLILVLNLFFFGWFWVDEPIIRLIAEALGG